MKRKGHILWVLNLNYIESNSLVAYWYSFSYNSFTYYNGEIKMLTLTINGELYANINNRKEAFLEAHDIAKSLFLNDNVVITGSDGDVIKVIPGKTIA